MPGTTLANLQIVPNKFSAYVLKRIDDKLTLVRRGIASGNPLLRQLIDATPQGCRFIEMPFVKPLEGDDWVFGEGDENDQTATGITTGKGTASLNIRWHMWSDSDLAHVLGGMDPMSAVGNLVADWWAQKEQAMYIAILKGILGGALASHVNDISGQAGDAALIGVSSSLDTKQLLGDSSGSLGMVFMHSAVYTHLQKNQDITTEYDATLQINIQTYLGYQVAIDDGMPYVSYEAAEAGDTGAVAVTTANIGNIQPHCATTLTAGTSYVVAVTPIYDTYFMGAGAFSREDGMPAGLVGVETDRDSQLANNYLIHRRCMVIHPNGFSWAIPTANGGRYTGSGMMFPNNTDLATSANWTLVSSHKNVPIACLRHKV